MRMNSARIIPAAKCPAVLPKDSAPLRMLLLLFCSAAVPSFRYWSIWAAERCRGPSASQTWICWIPVSASLHSSAKPATSCRPTRARAPPIRPMKPTTVMATASPLGTPFLLSQFFTGANSPASNAATITGISRKLTLLSSHTRAPATRMMSPRRQDQDAAILTP